MHYGLHSELYCRLYSRVYRRLYSGWYSRLNSRQLYSGGPSWMYTSVLSSCTSHCTLQTVHLVTEGLQLLQDQVSYRRRQGSTAGWAVRGRGGWLGRAGGPEAREVGGLKGLYPFTQYIYRIIAISKSSFERCDFGLSKCHFMRQVLYLNTLWCSSRGCARSLTRRFGFGPYTGRGGGGGGWSESD